MPTPSDQEELGERIGQSIGRVLEVIFSIYAVVVFIVLWIYVAAAVFTDGELIADTWAWLDGLDVIPAVIVWMAILPVAIFTWAWQADLSPIAMALVVLILIGWTAVAFWSPLRALARRTAVRRTTRR